MTSYTFQDGRLGIDIDYDKKNNRIFVCDVEPGLQAANLGVPVQGTVVSIADPDGKAIPVAGMSLSAVTQLFVSMAVEHYALSCNCSTAVLVKQLLPLVVFFG